MSGPDIIVIGGSAGSIQPLKTIVNGLPGSLPAAVMVVVHLPAEYPSLLPEILQRETELRVGFAQSGEKLCAGHVYVAPPDQHLELGKDRLRLHHGPRENRHRPAIDVLFRTAARSHGKQVTGVLLSGILDDGAAGIWAVQQAGGLTIVQDPQDAAHPDMPLAALEWIRPDRVLPAAKIDVQIAAWAANGRSSEHGAESSAQESEHAMASQENIEAESDARISGRPSPIACPECHGVLWEVESLPKPMFRCRVGHSYSLETLNCELSLATEGALWASLRILSEKAAIIDRMASRESGPRLRYLNEQLETFNQHIETLKQVITNLNIRQPRKTQRRPPAEAEKPEGTE